MIMLNESSSWKHGLTDDSELMINHNAAVYDVRRVKKKKLMTTTMTGVSGSHAEVNVAQRKCLTAATGVNGKHA